MQYPESFYAYVKQFSELVTTNIKYVENKHVQLFFIRFYNTLPFTF